MVVVYVMGVSGCGKSTVAAALAEKLGWTFHDGDDFHPQHNKDKMRSGTPLTDADRLPWLAAVHSRASSLSHSVIACSALKHQYRLILSEDIETVFLWLDVSRRTLETRVSSRPGHFMPSSLLDSQLSTLQPPSSCPEYSVLHASPSLCEKETAHIVTWAIREGRLDKK